MSHVVALPRNKHTGLVCGGFGFLAKNARLIRPGECSTLLGNLLEVLAAPRLYRVKPFAFGIGEYVGKLVCSFVEYFGKAIELW